MELTVFLIVSVIPLSEISVVTTGLFTIEVRCNHWMSPLSLFGIYEEKIWVMCCCWTEKLVQLKIDLPTFCNECFLNNLRTER